MLAGVVTTLSFLLLQARLARRGLAKGGAPGGQTPASS